MKILVTLSLLQTIALIVVIARLGGHSPQATLEPPKAPHPTISRRLIHASSISMDEQRLRSLIREELASELRVSSRRNDAHAAMQAPARDEAADQRRREFVGQQIEMYRSVGSMTEQQAQDLQAEILQLDPASRRQALSILVSAINAGQIRSQ